MSDKEWLESTWAYEDYLANEKFNEEQLRGCKSFNEGEEKRLRGFPAADYSKDGRFGYDENGKLIIKW